MKKTLTEIEVQIVTDVLVRGQYTELDIASFNHAVSNSLPTWRAEEIAGPKNNIAFQLYLKEILTSLNKA